MSPEPRGAIVGITRSAAEEILADETDRRLFLVEHDLRGLSSWQLVIVHQALGEAVRRENQRGGRIRYVQRIYAPDEQRCLCLFEAAGPDLVRSVNDIAQFPLARVMAVLSSVPDDAPA
jgi:hypothetical protein